MNGWGGGWVKLQKKKKEEEEVEQEKRRKEEMVAFIRHMIVVTIVPFPSFSPSSPLQKDAFDK